MDHSAPPDLDDVYDEHVLARIDGRPMLTVDEGGDPGPPLADEAPSPTARVPAVRRLGVGGALLAGAMVGLGDVLEPERARQHIIEYVPDEVDESLQLVTYHHVPGDPAASRIVVRPWLLEVFRRRRG